MSRPLHQLALVAAAVLTLLAAPAFAVPTVDAAAQAAPLDASALGHSADLGGSMVTPPIAGLEVSPVPEPGSYALYIAGLAVLGAVVRRRGPGR